MKYKITVHSTCLSSNEMNVPPCKALRELFLCSEELAEHILKNREYEEEPYGICTRWRLKTAFLPKSPFSDRFLDSDRFHLSPYYSPSGSRLTLSWSSPGCFWIYLYNPYFDTFFDEISEKRDQYRQFCFGRTDNGLSWWDSCRWKEIDCFHFEEEYPSPTLAINFTTKELPGKHASALVCMFEHLLNFSSADADPSAHNRHACQFISPSSQSFFYTFSRDRKAYRLADWLDRFLPSNVFLHTR